jgi:hypothetical protein
MDYAATYGDAVVAHMDKTPDKVVIYVGTRWPVRVYRMMTFSSVGFDYDYYTWSQEKGQWFSNASFKNSNDHTAPTAFVEIIARYSDRLASQEIWAEVPPDFKYPWE